MNKKRWSVGDIVREVVWGGPEVVEEVAEEWKRICSSPLNALPFCRPEWVTAYFRKQRKKQFWILTVRVSGRLAAVLPLVGYTKRLSFLPTRILRGPSEFQLFPFDIPIGVGSDRSAVVKELWTLLRDIGHWDVIEIPNVPEEGVAIELLKNAVEDGFSTCRWRYMNSPYLPLSEMRDVGEPISAARSANLRRTIRKSLNKCEKAGGIKTHHFVRADNAILQRLYQLEACGWKGDAGTAILSEEKERRFIQEIAQAGDELGCLSIHTVELDGQLGGVALGFEYKNRYFGLKMGWDQNLKNLAFGHLLTLAVVGDCIKKAISEVHLLGFESDWKSKWTDRVIPHSICYIYKNNIHGKIIKWLKRRSIDDSIRKFKNRNEHIEDNVTDI